MSEGVHESRERGIDCQPNIAWLATRSPAPPGQPGRFTPNSAMSTVLTITSAGAVCTLTLRPPEGKPPTLDYAVLDALERALGEIESRLGAARVVVVRSASPKYFCAGANLKVLETIDRDAIVPWVERGHALLNRLEALPVPVVACVEGYALGGGLELAMACDVIFASAAARFGQTEAKLGFVTGWGGSYRLVRRVGLARAKELVFSGRMIDAAEAVRIGLAEWQGAAAELEGRLQGFLAGVVECSGPALAEMKQILAACPHTRIDENAALEAAASRRVLTDGDATERLRAFLRSKAKG